jgi:hypothetical protein
LNYGDRGLRARARDPAQKTDTLYLRVFAGQLPPKIERDSSAPSKVRTEFGIGYGFKDIT